jgi:DNA-binding NarL/FixJ family response regulator
LDDLTPRELEVLALMAEGRSNTAIAARLVITVSAVEKHVAKAALFLAADGDYITGQQININGGVYM